MTSPRCRPPRTAQCPTSSHAFSSAVPLSILYTFRASSITPAPPLHTPLVYPSLISPYPCVQSLTFCSLPCLLAPNPRLSAVHRLLTQSLSYPRLQLAYPCASFPYPGVLLPNTHLPLSYPAYFSPSLSTPPVPHLPHSYPIYPSPTPSTLLYPIYPPVPHLLPYPVYFSPSLSTPPLPHLPSPTPSTPPLPCLPLSYPIYPPVSCLHLPNPDFPLSYPSHPSPTPSTLLYPIYSPTPSTSLLACLLLTYPIYFSPTPSTPPLPPSTPRLPLPYPVYLRLACFLHSLNDTVP